MSKPSGPIAKSGLELLTFGTPNGHKASIILEELKEAYGKPDYVYQSVNIGENIQKEPWFTKYGPNGRIPVLIDHDNGDLGKDLAHVIGHGMHTDVDQESWKDKQFYHTLLDISIQTTNFRSPRILSCRSVNNG